MAPPQRTAGQEAQGGSLWIPSAVDFKLPLPFLAGGARMIYSAALGADRNVFLPVAGSISLAGDLMVAGGIPYYVVTNYDPTYSLQVRNAIGTLVGTIGPQESGRIFLWGTDGNVFGVWGIKTKSLVEASQPTYEYFKIEFVGHNDDAFNALDYLQRYRGYGNTNPALVDIRIGSTDPQFATVKGSKDPDDAAIDSGELADGSKMIVHVLPYGHVHGAGGPGGRGATPTPGLLAEDGGDGGHAIKSYCDLVINNFSGIRGGGGGGGGGGAATATEGGGGGGGGAGYASGRFGASGGPGGHPGDWGGWVAGQGGSSSAGDGGAGAAFGGNGSPGVSGGTGGTGGSAIYYEATKTLTYIRTGSILGGASTF